MTVKLIHGDCLEEMPRMRAESVDAVITDPPYGINTKSDGMGKLNAWADMCNAATWYTAWTAECRRLLKPTGCLWSCLNWRSLVTYQKASCALNWPIESLLVWDKEWIGPGHHGLRPSYEMVALWRMPEFSIEDRSVADVQRFKWASYKPHGHPAEKPQALMEFLIRHSTQRGAVVLDPFMGSGTTGAACAVLAREFIGIEMDERHIRAATQRIGAEVAQSRLFSEAATVTERAITGG